MGSSNSVESRAADLSSYSSDNTPLPLLSLASALSKNTPPPLFTHPSEVNGLLRTSKQFEDFSVPALLEGNSGEDQQLWDNSTKTSWSSLAPLLPVQIKKQKSSKHRQESNTSCLASVYAPSFFFFLTAYFARSPFLHSKGRFCLREEFSGRRTIQSRLFHKTIMRYHLTFGRIMLEQILIATLGSARGFPKTQKSQKRREIRNP